MTSKKKFLIIGAGLSGITTSLELIKRGHQVSIIDNNVNFSSRIAAGIINPLVFRRMTKSWRVDDFIPFLKSHYKELEELTKSVFFHELPIRRLFSSEQERDFWLEKQEREEFKPFMFKVNDDDMGFDLAKNPFGSGRVKETYYIDVLPFLTGTKEWLKENATIINEEFNQNILEGTTYRSITYDDIIFCQGYLNPDNVLFSDLPLDQTKGQTLTIKSAVLPKDVSLNRKCFMLPRGSGTFKIGSTYEWNDPTTHTTKEAKQELLNNLSYIIDEDVEVLSQEAGIRPTTRDRRPLVGTHKTFQNYHIINGLGAKGYMLAPLICEEFCDYLLNGKELDPEIDINRYYRRNNP